MDLDAFRRSAEFDSAGMRNGLASRFHYPVQSVGVKYTDWNNQKIYEDLTQHRLFYKKMVRYYWKLSNEMTLLSSGLSTDCIILIAANRTSALKSPISKVQQSAEENQEDKTLANHAAAQHPPLNHDIIFRHPQCPSETPRTDSSSSISGRGFLHAAYALTACVAGNRWVTKTQEWRRIVEDIFQYRGYG
jgi:hypothetical protein